MRGEAGRASERAVQAMREQASPGDTMRCDAGPVAGVRVRDAGNAMNFAQSRRTSGVEVKEHENRINFRSIMKLCE